MLCGIDIGGTKCAVVFGDKDGNIYNKVKFETTDKDSCIERFIKEVAKCPDPEAIGISCGGPLDEKNGLILSPPNLKGWDNVPICKILKDRFGVPTTICNDANAGAVAEWRYGAGKGYNNVVFITFGTGLGSGLILNGKLYSGANGFAGEIGHLRLSDVGPVGYGKTGSFEGFCSGGGIRQLGEMKALEYRQRGEKVAFYNGGEFTAKEICDAAYAGDKCALEVMDICAEYLGRGLSLLCDIIDPEIIIIGSIYMRCRDLLEEKAKKIIEKEALKHPIITVPTLGEKIGDMAALAVAMEGLA